MRLSDWQINLFLSSDHLAGVLVVTAFGILVVGIGWACRGTSRQSLRAGWIRAVSECVADADDVSSKTDHSAIQLRDGGACEVRFFFEQLDLAEPRYARIDPKAPRDPVREIAPRFAFADASRDALLRRPYWSVKRAFDLVVSTVLIFVLSPVLLLTALVVAFGLGRPILFVQNRPGLRSHPFRLYKFRSMSPPRNAEGSPLSNEKRTSALGAFLRRTRLDELPQLFNILRGDMSFVGPRPLLAEDQSVRDRARLLVRPGLTGWAQVIGGRDVSRSDKAALDVWYIKNASFALDMEIALRTVPIVLCGERVYDDQVRLAWRELRADAVVR